MRLRFKVEWEVLGKNYVEAFFRSAAQVSDLQSGKVNETLRKVTLG